LAGPGTLSGNVFITGCSGAVGSRLTHLLLKSGYKVRGVRGSKPCKIMDKNHFCEELNLLSTTTSLNLVDFKPDILVHTAWITTPSVFWESPMNDQWVKASKKLIKEFVQSGGKYLIVTSTCAEYSWETTSPISETSKTSPLSRYGKSKLELLTWVRQQEIPFLWTRTFFQFGLDEPNGRLIPSIIDALLAGKNFEVKNSNDIRDFIFIEDVVQVLAKLIEKKYLGVINIGTGSGIDVRSISKLISGQIRNKDLVTYSKPVQLGSSVVSNTEKLLSVVEGYSWTRIEDSISKTIECRLKENFGIQTTNY
jgi:nucleoside-diphosphate-sugar epimerase